MTTPNMPSIDQPPTYDEATVPEGTNTPSQPKSSQPSTDAVPPYRASHGFADNAEEIAALNEFAQSRLYIDPGTEGTLDGLGGGVWTARGPMGGDTLQWKAERHEADEMRKKLKEEKKIEKQRKASAAKEAEGEVKGAGMGEKLKRVLSGGKEA
jgi:hypothetical protein